MLKRVRVMPLLFLVVSATHRDSFAAELFVAPDGQATHLGTQENPLSFAGALKRAAEMLEGGARESGLAIIVQAGRYRFEQPFVLGPELSGSEASPLVIRAADGAQVWFDGSARIPSDGFAPVTDVSERTRLARVSAEKILATTITDQTLIARFNQKLMLNLSYNGRACAPAVFPNDGYARLAGETVAPEVCPPGVPVGTQGYGIRAGNPPHQEPGKAQGWRGSLDEPRGAQAKIADRVGEMAGTWEQWEHELKRNNRRNGLTGYVEADWLLSTQPVFAASAERQCLHLSRALAYGWAWRMRDKRFRIFGLLCELDQPGEWCFDPLSNRLFIYPPEPLTPETEVSLAVAAGFVTLRGASHVHLAGLNVEHVGSGAAYEIKAGTHNLIAGCTVRESTAIGVAIAGAFNAVRGCDLLDLDMHVALRGGRRSATEITPGHNVVENCHIYQKRREHHRVTVAVSGVGNQFRHNLVHNSAGQAMTVHGNDHVIELNEFFNIGFEEGDGGAVYSGADLTGYGVIYRHNFFHHLMHVPGKVERSGIHLDDLQAGATCVGNLFYKSAAKGIFMNGGAGHTVRDNVFLEGFRGIYNVGVGAQKTFEQQQGISTDPEHKYRNTKENYVGRAEAIVGPKGWTQSPWLEKYPLFHRVMSDVGKFGRLWPIRCHVANNFYFGNTRKNATIWSRVAPEARVKSVIENDRAIEPTSFVDYSSLDLQFKEGVEGLPQIPFERIGLELNEHRDRMPDKSHYRSQVKKFFEGIGSMPGTTKRLDTARVVGEAPVRTRQ